MLPPRSFPPPPIQLNEVSHEHAADHFAGGVVTRRTAPLGLLRQLGLWPLRDHRRGAGGAADPGADGAAMNDLVQVKAMNALKDLESDAEDNAMVRGSAILVLQGVRALLDECVVSQDMSRVAKLAQALNNSAEDLAEAIAYNTVAE